MVDQFFYSLLEGLAAAVGPIGPRSAQVVMPTSPGYWRLLEVKAEGLDCPPQPGRSTSVEGVRAVKTGEDQLRAIIDTIPVLAWSARPEGSAEFFNRRWLDYAGLSIEVARDWGWTAAVHPDDLNRLTDYWRSILGSGEPGEIEARLRRFDGEYRWFLFRAEPLRDDLGKILRWYGTNIDIEKRKQAEALLAAEKRTLEMIAGGARLADILENLCDTIDAQAGNSISAVMLMDTDGMRLWPAASPRLPKSWIEAITPFKIGPGTGSCGSAAFQKQRVIVSDIATDPLWVDYRDVALSYGLRAAWSQPLLSKSQQVLGTFGMYYTEARTPSETDLLLIEGAGHIAVIAIEGERAQAALTSALEEIAKSEAELRTILDAIPQLIIAIGADGNFLYANQAVLEYTGLPKEELSPERSREVFHPEDSERLRDQREAAIARRLPFTYERRVRRGDGQYRWFLVQYKPLLDQQGEVIRWYTTGTDIDDRKRAEEKLQRSEWNLLEAQRLGHTGSWSVDIASQTVTASPEMLRLVGFKPGEDCSSNDYHFHKIHPEDRERVRALFRRCVNERVDFEAHYRMLGDDGAIKYMHSIGHPVLDEAGKLVEFVGAVIDTTEQTEARIALENALAEVKLLRDQLYKENLALRDEVDRVSMFEEILGTSQALQAVVSRVIKVAPTDSSVLITGETGTGKELIARAIHKRSMRSQRAFVSVNCAALAPSLISSELFGHEKGAFTGATQRRLGRFELANGGTIFLDEVGELPTDTQVALLRVLQEREFERVGGTQSIQVDVRMVAATNRDLEAAIANGTFRRDLFYRLNVFPIQMPPLRERKDDILTLLEYFVQRFGRKVGKNFSRIDKRTVELFRSYDWPGNVRELQNVVERSVIVSPDDVFCVDEAWLSTDAGKTRPGQHVPESTDGDSGRERQIIETALTESAGRVYGTNGAAAKLRIPPSTLDSKIKKLKIRKSRFKLC
jgi:PAS domain S-box-containing protein